VDETLAHRFWADGDAVGQEIRLSDPKSTKPWMRIVGVVKTAKHGEVTEEATRHVYIPMDSRTGARWIW
jgi:hypothetical protein